MHRDSQERFLLRISGVTIFAAGRRGVICGAVAAVAVVALLLGLLRI